MRPRRAGLDPDTRSAIPTKAPALSNVLNNIGREKIGGASLVVVYLIVVNVEPVQMRAVGAISGACRSPWTWPPG